MTLEDAHQLVQNLFTAVLVFDGDLRLKSMNSAGEQLLSIGSRKSIGLTSNEFMPLSPQFSEIICRSLSTSQNFTERGIFLTLPNTKTITVDCMVTPLLDNEQNQEVIVEVIDTHAMNRVMHEEKLSLLNNAARNSLRGIAHEIKNPLGGLRGAAQLLEKELNGSELTEYTQIIIQEADRLSNLVNRMATPSYQISVSPVNIHEVLEYVYTLVEAESTQPLSVERDYDPSVPMLEADREQLVQAILNIIRNAMQATGEDGHIALNTRIKRKCTIHQELHKLAVQIEVIDDGAGIPEEIENGIYFPLVTGRAEGTGLGLSIAQSLIQSHGGIIEHERRDNRTVFRIILPIKESHE